MYSFIQLSNSPQYNLCLVLSAFFKSTCPGTKSQLVTLLNSAFNGFLCRPVFLGLLGSWRPLYCVIYISAVASTTAKRWGEGEFKDSRVVKLEQTSPTFLPSFPLFQMGSRALINTVTLLLPLSPHQL